MMSRSHRARAVRPAESPVEDLRATHDAWTRDLLDRLPHGPPTPRTATHHRARGPRGAVRRRGRPPGAAASVAGTSGARGATGRDGSARAADRGADLGGSDARGAAGRATQWPGDDAWGRPGPEGAGHAIASPGAAPRVHGEAARPPAQARQELVERDEQNRIHVQRIEAVVSSMATGEVVPTAGPASTGAWDGARPRARSLACRGDGGTSTGF